MFLLASIPHRKVFELFEYFQYLCTRIGPISQILQDNLNLAPIAKPPHGLKHSPVVFNHSCILRITHKTISPPILI